MIVADHQEAKKICVDCEFVLLKNNKTICSVVCRDCGIESISFCRKSKWSINSAQEKECECHGHSQS